MSDVSELMSLNAFIRGCIEPALDGGGFQKTGNAWELRDEHLVLVTLENRDPAPRIMLQCQWGMIPAGHDAFYRAQGKKRPHLHWSLFGDTLRCHPPAAVQNPPPGWDGDEYYQALWQYWDLDTRALIEWACEELSRVLREDAAPFWQDAVKTETLMLALPESDIHGGSFQMISPVFSWGEDFTYLALHILDGPLDELHTRPANLADQRDNGHIRMMTDWWARCLQAREHGDDVPGTQASGRK